MGRDEGPGSSSLSAMLFKYRPPQPIQRESQKPLQTLLSWPESSSIPSPALHRSGPSRSLVSLIREGRGDQPVFLVD